MRKRRPQTARRRRRRPSTRLVALISATLAGPYSCGTKMSGTEAAQAQSTTKAGNTLGSALASLHLPVNLAELLAMLKSSGVLKAFKDAYAKGTCKPQIQDVITTGRTMVGQLIKSGLPSILSLGTKTTANGVDFATIEPALSALGKCVADAAPEILAAIDTTLNSQAAGTAKLAAPGGTGDLFTNADLQALDLENWPEADPGAEADAGPAGDPGIPAEAPAAP